MISLLPVLYDDPFIKYRPFPKEESSNYFVNHWHEIAFSAGFYLVIQKLSTILCPRYFGKHYNQLSPGSKVNFDIHVVSMVQCVISLATLAPMWNHEFFQNRADDPYNSLYGYYPYGGLVASLAVGYFLWDLFVCIKYFKLFGFGFLFHGGAAFFVFSQCLKPFCLPWIAGFLLFEGSTPFVNINWFASKVPGMFSDRVVLINGVLLLLSFFLIRIVWGFYAVALVATDIYKTWGHIHHFFPVVTLVLNAGLDILNVFWFYKMILIAKKKIRGKPTKSTAKEVAEKID